MTAFLQTLREGGWLTVGRMRLWALAVLAASAAALVFLIATSDGLNDYQGRPLGTDLSNMYVAGVYALEGRPEAPFDFRLQVARTKELFGPDAPFYGYLYPPLFYLIAAPLALMPYQLALVVWQALTLALYLWMLRAISLPLWNGSAGRPPVGRVDVASTGEATHLWLLLAVAFPAVFVNIGHGQNGFLTAALVGGALLLLDRRPVIAGILFGLLAYKPQFGLLIPLVLLVTGRWRTIFSATATVVLLAVVTTLIFGLETWRAFFASTAFSRAILEQGGPGWHVFQSLFAFVRMAGGSIPLAYAAQAALTISLAGALVWLWRSQAAFALKAAALCLGMALATPYGFDYDMVLLAPAIAFLAVDGLRRGFAPYALTALAALWVVPLVARIVVQATFVPVGVIVMLAVFALIMRRAQADLAAANTGLPAPATR
jgi:alpha-1,2-mannosyltransferase